MSEEPLFPTGFYDHLFQNSQDAVFVLDGPKITDCNRAASKLFGCDKASIAGRTLLDFSPENQKDGNSLKLFREYFSPSENPAEFDWIFVIPSGKKIYCRLQAYTSNSDWSRMQVIARASSGNGIPEAITDSKFANLVLNIFPGLFFVYDVTDGFNRSRLVSFNKKWYCEKLGYSCDDLPEGYPDFIFSPGSASEFEKIIQELNQNHYADFEMEVRHRGGYEIPYLFVANLFRTGNRIYFTGFGIDISERKYTELALRHSEEYFKNIFNSSTDGILVMDLDFRLLNANNAIFRMFDYKFEDVAFQSVLDFMPESARELLKSRVNRLVSGQQTAPIEIEVKKSTGEPIPIEINSIVIRYGERTGLLTTVRDLTERKILEKKIFTSEITSEEKERERFSKELHDGLGPILSTCKIYLHSLNEMIEGREDLLKISGRALSLLDEALGSIKEISNNLSPHVLRNFGLVQAVIAFTHNLETISNLKFEVHYNYDERLNEIVEFTAYRIIIELINNSVKYAEASLIVIDISLTKPLLKVVYQDDGKGFLKDDGRKKGFGLNNIQARISKFNGDYSYKTSPGKGVLAEFTLDINQSAR